MLYKTCPAGRTYGTGTGGTVTYNMNESWGWAAAACSDKRLVACGPKTVQTMLAKDGSFSEAEAVSVSPAEGQNMLVLKLAGARAEQPVNGLDIGRTYTLSYKVRYSGVSTIPSILVSTDGCDVPYVTVLPDLAQLSWSTQSVSFTATAVSTVVCFKNVDDNISIYLDDLSLSTTIDYVAESWESKLECVTPDPPVDEHGCSDADGENWCEGKQKCLKAWEEECEDDDRPEDMMGYEGCYTEDDNEHDLCCGPKDYGYDRAMCRAACMDGGFHYFALHDGGRCTCDNSFSTPIEAFPKVSDADCGGADGVGGETTNSVYSIRE